MGRRARAAAARDLRRHAVLDGAAAVLDRPLLRREVLRAPAARARGDAPAVGPRPGGAAQDAALPAEPALPVQHAERDLDAGPRRPEPHREPRGLAPVRVPALYARPGPDEEGHAAPGARRAQSLPRHREAALRRPAAPRVRRGRARRVRARAVAAAAAAGRERDEVRDRAARAGRVGHRHRRHRGPAASARRRGRRARAAAGRRQWPTAAASACATRGNGSRCCTATRTPSRWPTPRRGCASRCACRWRSGQPMAGAIRAIIVDDEPLARRGLELRLRAFERFRDRRAVRERPRGDRRGRRATRRT